MIELTSEQVQDIVDFINSSLESKWDNHTNHFICRGVSYEDGKRRMNPEMYDLAELLQKKLCDEQE